MKLDVKTPDFCPDNCPICNIEIDTYYRVNGDIAYTDFICGNADICKQALKNVKRSLKK